MSIMIIDHRHRAYYNMFILQHLYIRKVTKFNIKTARNVEKRYGIEYYRLR